MQRRYDDELNFLVWLRILWKRRYLFVLMVGLGAVSTAVYSLRLPNIYMSYAVITPVGSKEKAGKGLTLLSQQLGDAVGITMPSPTTTTEIINILNSSRLREKIIKKYGLTPVLLGGEAGAEADKGYSLNMDVSGLTGYLAGLLRRQDALSAPGGPQADPLLWDSLRALDSVVNIANRPEENTIVISAEFHDPRKAAEIVEDFLEALTDHMSMETKRVAKMNIEYLERQLSATTDPFIRQKIYNVIAQQVETSIMAEVKENYAFKVIDPPRAPDRKIGPKRVSMLALSLAASIAAAVFLAFALEYVSKATAREEGRG